MGIKHTVELAEQLEARIAFRMAYRVDLPELEKIALWQLHAPILHNPGPGPEDE